MLFEWTETTLMFSSYILEWGASSSRCEKCRLLTFGETLRTMWVSIHNEGLRPWENALFALFNPFVAFLLSDCSVAAGTLVCQSGSPFSVLVLSVRERERERERETTFKKREKSARTWEKSANSPDGLVARRTIWIKLCESKGRKSLTQLLSFNLVWISKSQSKIHNQLFFTLKVES